MVSFSSGSKDATTLSHPPHPFYPQTVELVGYLANDKNALELLTIFLSGWVVILAVTWWAASQYRPKVKTSDKWVVLWFILTGTIHLFFEGYFSVNHATMAPSMGLFGQLWKEYAKSDSRYLTSDPFVLCMESCTAFLWGPLSYVTAYLVVIQHPARYPIQAVVCMGQIYGLILYYATGLFDMYYNDLHYSRPEAYYFWFYFFFVNFIWMAIPGWLLYQSADMTTKAFKALDRMAKTLQSNGTIRDAPKSNGHKKDS